MCAPLLNLVLLWEFGRLISIAIPSAKSGRQCPQSGEWYVHPSRAFKGLNGLSTTSCLQVPQQIRPACRSMSHYPCPLCNAPGPNLANHFTPTVATGWMKAVPLTLGLCVYCTVYLHCTRGIPRCIDKTMFANLL